MTIVEWRPTPGKLGATSATPEAIAVVDATCALAAEGFERFAAQQGLDLGPERVPIEWMLSFLPADIYDHGRDRRALNGERFRALLSGIRAASTWGITEPALRHTFVENDALMPGGTARGRFRLTLSHELWHAFSFNYYLAHRLGRDREERLAEQFAHWLIDGKP
jgi:hypothetical protein